MRRELPGTVEVSDNILEFHCTHGLADGFLEAQIAVHVRALMHLARTEGGRIACVRFGAWTHNAKDQRMELSYVGEVVPR